MPLQNISDRVTRQHVTHISESTLDPQISPASVFVGETKNKRSNLRRRAWPARCTARAAVILLGNQFPMPSQQGRRRDDCRDLFQDITRSAKTCVWMMSLSLPALIGSPVAEGS